MQGSDAHRQRSSVLELLALLGDPESQRTYEEEVPIANVPAELVCMWFDDLADQRSGWGAFSEAERVALTEFDAFYEAQLDALTLDAGVDGLQACSEWGAVGDRARSLLAQLRRDPDDRR